MNNQVQDPRDILKQPWYYNTWFICLLVALWFLIIPAIGGVILLIMKTIDYQQRKKQFDLFIQNNNFQIAQNQRMFSDNSNLFNSNQQLYVQNKELQNQNSSLNEEHTALSDKVNTLSDELLKANQQYADLKATLTPALQLEIDKLNCQIQSKKQELINVTADLLYQECGLFTPEYTFASALEYKDELSITRKQQKELISTGQAVTQNGDNKITDDPRKDRRIISDMKKLILRTFNMECDEIISNVKYTNYDLSNERIYKSAENISKFGSNLGLSITQEYINAKINELHLAFEYAERKERDKEDLRMARAEQKEQARAAKEMELERARIEKEQTHYQNAFKQIEKQLAFKPDDNDLIEKKEALEKKLQSIDKSLVDIDYRQANMKAGYVYIISNIGSFGKNIYKIGMTRRLYPQDRVDELGDASVPFKFDVHAMIFSDDAPALEAALHREFEDRKVNMINQRREFFHVTLDEIKEVVKRNYDKTVEFVDVPEAEQYRLSEKLRNES